jgi:hypothetical protein
MRPCCYRGCPRQAEVGHRQPASITPCPAPPRWSRIRAPIASSRQRAAGARRDRRRFQLAGSPWGTVDRRNEREEGRNVWANALGGDCEPAAAPLAADAVAAAAHDVRVGTRVRPAQPFGTLPARSGIPDQRGGCRCRDCSRSQCDATENERRAHTGPSVATAAR